MPHYKVQSIFGNSVGTVLTYLNVFLKFNQIIMKDFANALMVTMEKITLELCL